MRFQFVLGAPVVRIRLVALTFKHSHLVIEFAPAQWVLDEMQVRSNPVPDGVQPGGLDHFFHWNRTTVGYKLHAHRITITNYVIAEEGPESVGPNQGIAFIRCATGTTDPRAVVQVLNGDNFP